jgi:beta-1,4-mannosyltransferase
MPKNTFFPDNLTVDPSFHYTTLCNFVPQWPSNPYHAELSKHLLKCGVRVANEDRLKTIFQTIRASHNVPYIIHIHAIPQFSFSLLAMSRVFMFWSRLIRLRTLGVRIVWTIHDSSHHEARYPTIDRMLAKKLYYQVDATIVHSLAARKAVEIQWNVNRNERLFIIPHGNYIGCYPNTKSRKEAREKLKIPHGKMVFLFLGMIRPYKGVLRLIETFKFLSNSGTYLLIAGKPISEMLSSEVLKAIGDSTDIQYHPHHIIDDDMQYYLNAADVVVFPYTKALTSGALILAMSFGRACIVPKMGALEDTIDERGGFLYDPSNGNGLFKAMEGAVRAHPNLDAMGDYNWQRADAWSWSKVAQMTSDVYLKCLSSRH